MPSKSVSDSWFVPVTHDPVTCLFTFLLRTSFLEEGPVRLATPEDASHRFRESLDMASDPEKDRGGGKESRDSGLDSEGVDGVEERDTRGYHKGSYLEDVWSKVESQTKYLLVLTVRCTRTDLFERRDRVQVL